MNLIYLLILIILLIILVLYYTLYKSKLHMITNYINLNYNNKVIPNNELLESNSDIYTYTSWIYINSIKMDGAPKIIFKKSNSQNEITLMLINDNLFLVIQDNNKKILSNVPIQKWMHIIISSNSNIIDVYINGKIIISYVLPFTPIYSYDIKYGINFGILDALIGKFSRYNYYITNNEAWNLYKSSVPYYY